MNINLSTTECLDGYKFDLQCKYGEMVSTYIKRLKFGKCVKDLFIDLQIFNNLLDIINMYDDRDIPLEDIVWNCISVNTLSKCLTVLP